MLLTVQFGKISQNPLIMIYGHVKFFFFRGRGGGGVVQRPYCVWASVSLKKPFMYDGVILQPRPESFSFFLLW